MMSLNHKLNNSLVCAIQRSAARVSAIESVGEPPPRAVRATKAQGQRVSWSTTSRLQQCIENLYVMVRVLRVPDAGAWEASARNPLRSYTAHLAIVGASALQPSLITRRSRPGESSRRRFRGHKSASVSP